VLRRDLDLLARRAHDVVVVGGGIHGAAAAWEAAARGLSVALVEAADFGSGASWNSLKTIHGGLRHLQRLDVAGLRESARERRALLTIAPGLVRPLGFLALASGRGTSSRAALAVGLAASELLTRDRGAPEPRLPPSRTLREAEVLAHVPGLTAAPQGGALWWDAQVESSERLVLGFLHAAADAGGIVANRVEATGVLRDEVVCGITARDLLTGHTMDLRAEVVINAAGPAIGLLVQAAGLPGPKLAAARAVNLVLRRAIVRDVAVGARAGGRYLFAVPWRDRTVVGTGYGPAAMPVADLAAAFLDEARRAFPWAGLGRDDVALVHEGLVPARGARPIPLTRSRLVDHDAEHNAPGLLTVVAAKFTTARAIAEQAIDLVVERLDRPPAPSRTATTPLPEARLLDGPLRERARIAVQKEMALSLADVVLRRLDLGTAGPPPAEDVGTVVSVLAHEFGWDLARIGAEQAALAAFYAARGVS
jgi:glycerol-3-phosphate dehydrogenase